MLSTLTDHEWAQPTGQHPNLTRHLMKIGNEVWDYNIWGGEHAFQNAGTGEAGYQVEMELWGCSISGLLSESNDGLSQALESLTLIVKGANWPNATAGLQKDSINRADWLHETHGEAFPMDHIAKLFTENFWQTEFVQYGHESLKQLGPDREHKLLFTKRFRPPNVMDIHFGRAEAGFLRHLTHRLFAHRFDILGMYVRSATRDAIRRRYVRVKWVRDLNSWIRTWCPLNEPITQFVNAAEMGIFLDSTRTNGWDAHMEEYNKYLADHRMREANNQALGPAVDFKTWKGNLDRTWTNTFKLGGTIMRRAAEIRRLMEKDISFISQIVLEFLTLPKVYRKMVYKGFGMDDSGPIGIIYGRVTGLLKKAMDIAVYLDAIGGKPGLVNLKAAYERWVALFRKTARNYNRILLLLGEEDKYDPDDWTWKATIHSLPSSAWKSEADNIKVLAHQIYQKVDPRIREALDLAARILATGRDNSMFPALPNEAEIKDLLKGMRVENRDLMAESPQSILSGTAARSGTPITHVDNFARRSSVPGQPNSFWDDIAAREAAARDHSASSVTSPISPTSNTGIVFGQPSIPRLTAAATPSQGSRRTPLPARGGVNTSRRGSTPLGVTGGRVSKHTDPLPGFGFRNNGTRSRALRMDALAGRGEISFGSAGPLPSSTDTRFRRMPQTGQTGRAPLRPFPHPYAVPETVSADVKNYEVETDINAQFHQVLYESDGYASQDPYREMGVGMGMDIDSNKGSP